MEFQWNFTKRFGRLLVFFYISRNFQRGKFNLFAKNGSNFIIFKTGDRSWLKNYRPISLTNTDYKILAFVLAMRVQKVMPSLINNDQTGYIKDRFIGFNIRTVQDLIEYCNKFDKMGVLLFLDFKKAFDSLEWKFLQKVVKKFNFGPIFQKWVSILYTEPEAVIKTMAGYLKILICQEESDKGVLHQLCFLFLQLKLCLPF